MHIETNPLPFCLPPPLVGGQHVLDGLGLNRFQTPRSFRFPFFI
jgi:hypothetical protein